MDVASLSGYDQVYIGNGQGLPINSIGTMSFPSNYHPNITLTLHNLLHVPSITKNLVSVSQFAKDNNVYFEFHSNVCYVKFQVTSRILLRGHLGDDGLYQFDHSTMSPPSALSSSKPAVYSAWNPSTYVSSSKSASFSSHCNNDDSSNTASSSKVVSNLPSLYQIWHHRLGHPHYEVLRTILNLCNQNLPNKTLSDFCSSCCLGKAHRLPSFSSIASYTKPLELIFCDLWGPTPVESFDGFSYFLTCVDAYSRFTWIFPLKLKSHTLQTFVNFKRMVELQYNSSIKSVQTDGGGEFRPFTKKILSLVSLIYLSTHSSPKWFC